MRKILLLTLSCLALSAYAKAPPSTITSATIIADATTNYGLYGQTTIIGTCWWKVGPVVYPTLELDQYQPDLIVTVFDQMGDDPWLEANTVLDPVLHIAATTTTSAAFGENLGYGNSDPMPTTETGSQGIHTYVVDVVGDPFMAIPMPMTLLRDTTPMLPYYSSDLDAPMDRMGFAEALQLNTYNPFEYYLGSSPLSNWGYLYPRVMTILQPNNYEGSVLAGLHAAAIVTNKNYLHIVHSTSDSCGINCAVANVNTKTQNAIFEEIYPYDKQITLGDMGIGSSTPVGSADDQAGNGNYVFQIWRHYKGCIQGFGKFVSATVVVPPTQKM